MVFDINGLKEINDHFGHDAGDKLIIGAAQCIEQCFGSRGKLYRIGGDEFVVLTHADQEERITLLVAFEKQTEAWKENNHLELHMSYGCVHASEYSDYSITELGKEADKRMYTAKALYYQENGRDRRSRKAVSGLPDE